MPPRLRPSCPFVALRLPGRRMSPRPTRSRRDWRQPGGQTLRWHLAGALHPQTDGHTAPPRERSAGPVTSLGGLSDFVVPDQYFQCKWLCPAPDRITHRSVAACRSFVRATAAALLPVWTHRSDPFHHSWSRAQTLRSGMMRRVQHPRSLRTAKECATGASQACQQAQDRALATKDRLGSTR
jgi:hypothetical protein